MCVYIYYHAIPKVCYCMCLTRGGPKFSYFLGPYKGHSGEVGRRAGMEQDLGCGEKCVAVRPSVHPSKDTHPKYRNSQGRSNTVRRIWISRETTLCLEKTLMRCSVLVWKVIRNHNYRKSYKSERLELQDYVIWL